MEGLKSAPSFEVQPRPRVDLLWRPNRAYLVAENASKANLDALSDVEGLDSV